MGYFFGFVIIASALVLTIVAMDAIPPDYLNWTVGPAVIIIGIIRFRLWRKKKSAAMDKQRDENELDYLEELIREHIDGIKDRRPQIKFVVGEIEKRKSLSHRAERLMSDAHVALQLGSTEELRAKLNAALRDEANKWKK